MPPQLALYHCQSAPLPKAPPTTFNVTGIPAHIVSREVVALVGAVEDVPTLIVSVVHVVVLQVPSALT